MKFVRLFAFFLTGTLLHADQITLKNGDRLTGQIVKKDGAKLTIKTELLGDVVAPWDSITDLVSSEPIHVVLPDGRTVLGRVTVSNGVLSVATDTARETVEVPKVPALRNDAEQRIFDAYQHPGLTELWAGYVDVGLSLARGNARTNTLATSFNATRATTKDKTSLYFNQIYSTARVDNVVAASAQAVRGGWAYSHTIRDGFFYNVFNDYENDRFQNLDLRFVLGGGAGYTPIKNERSRLDLLGGGAYNREKFTNRSRDSAEAYFGDDWTYATRISTNFRQSFRMFTNLSNPGEYRMNFDIGTATTLRKWLSLQLTASDRFLSNPVLGRKRNDVLLTTGVRLSFNRTPK